MPEAIEPTQASAKLSGVEKLADRHIVDGFECGKHSLDDWLKRHALKNQKLDSAQTYVVHKNLAVVGYYSLTAGSIVKKEAPEQIGMGLPAYPIGVILLARLAIDQKERKTGLGGELLKDALLRCVAAADSIGARAVLVHALDDDARSFYEHYNFVRCPENDMHLMVLIKDLRASLPQLG